MVIMVDRQKLHQTLFPTELEPEKISKFRWFWQVFLCGIVMHVPLLGAWLRRSFTIFCMCIVTLRKKNDQYLLFKLIMDGLESPYYRVEKRVSKWWFIMRLGVAFAQEMQIKFFEFNPELESNLIRLGCAGPQPKQGYDVAYSFVGFSLWFFERGDVNGAIEMIKVAITAEPTWGYPEYLLGWYGLFTNGVDSVEHFSKAASIDWGFLHRMNNDQACQQHPDIIRQVKQNVLISSQSK